MSAHETSGTRRGTRALSVSVSLAVLSLSAGCGTKYAILRRTDFQNPPSRRLRLVVTEFRDLTGQYERVGERIEEIIRRQLKEERVEINVNITFSASERPHYYKEQNIFEPVAATGSRAAHRFESGLQPDTTGTSDALGLGQAVDLELTGTIEEVYFGPRGFDTGFAAVFGLIGVAATADDPAGRLTSRFQIREAATGKNLLTRRVSTAALAGDRGREEVLRTLAGSNATAILSYLLERL